MTSQQSSRSQVAQRVGRVVLGLAVGASFGIAVGALTASWIWGVEAIESEAVAASYLAGAITVLGAVVGGVLGYRVGRAGGSEVVVQQNTPAE